MKHTSSRLPYRGDHNARQNKTNKTNITTWLLNHKERSLQYMQYKTTGRGRREVGLNMFNCAQIIALGSDVSASLHGDIFWRL